MSHSLCLEPNEGEAFFAFLKRERSWKTANIKLHGPVYCTPAYTTQKGAKLAVNFYTKHDFVDVVNREPGHFDVGTQATFRDLVKAYRQWCQSESSTDDEEQRNTVPERTPQQKAPEETSKQDEAQGEQDPDDDISDTEDGTSQSTAASESPATLTPQSADQPPKKRGRVGSPAAETTRTRKKTPATSRGAGFVPRSPPRTTGPTIGRATRVDSSQQNVSQSAPRQRGRKPSSTTTAPASSAVASSESFASCSSLVDAAKHLQKALADAKEEYKKLKRYQKVLGHHMSMKVKDLFDVLQAYDAKLELSIDEVIKRNEARLKELVASNEQDDKLIGELLKLLRQVLNDKKQASSTSSQAIYRPILSADARAVAIVLSELLKNYTKAGNHRLQLEKDKALLSDVGNQALDDVMNAAKRCGNSKTVAAALAFVNKALETVPTVGSMAARHKTVLRDVCTMLLEA